MVGTTGMSDEDLDELADLFGDGRANCILAPNFAIGAVLMMKFAALAAPWFETARSSSCTTTPRSTPRRAPPC